jgi:hypothetical protein
VLPCLPEHHERLYGCGCQRSVYIGFLSAMLRETASGQPDGFITHGLVAWSYLPPVRVEPFLHGIDAAGLKLNFYYLPRMGAPFVINRRLTDLESIELTNSLLKNTKKYRLECGSLHPCIG